MKTFKLKKDADAFRRKVERELTDGVRTPDSVSVTVAEACRLWIENARREGREHSIVRHYKLHADLHITPMLGTMKLSKLTKPTVAKFRADLLDGGMSGALCAKVLVSLSSAIGFAQEQGLVGQNVARGAGKGLAGRKSQMVRSDGRYQGRRPPLTSPAPAPVPIAPSAPALSARLCRPAWCA